MWDKGIRLDVLGLERLGMREDVLQVLRDGTDMCLEEVPAQGKREVNYSSFLNHQNPLGVEDRLLGLMAEGYLEEVEHRGLGVIPMGVVPKPGDDVGRIVTDLTASGFNAAVRDLPFTLPTVRDAVR